MSNFDPLSHYSWGDLNPLMNQVSAKRLKEGTALGSLKKANLSQYEKNILSGVHHFKAIVLQVVQQETASDSWATTIQADENNGEDYNKPMRMEIVACIPELHGAVLPTPRNILGPPELIDHEAIRRYPTFIAKDQNVAMLGTPKPGDLIWVDFGNRDTFADPLYLGPVVALQAVPPGFVTGVDRHGRPCTPNMPEISKIDDSQVGGSVNVPTIGLESKDIEEIDKSIEQLEAELVDLQTQIENTEDPELQTQLLQQQEQTKLNMEAAVAESIKERERQEFAETGIVPCEIDNSVTRSSSKSNPPDVGQHTTVELLPNAPYKERRVYLNVFGRLSMRDAVKITGTTGLKPKEPNGGGTQIIYVHPLVRTRLQLLNEAWLAGPGEHPFLVVSGLREPGIQRYSWLVNPKSWRFKRAGKHEKGPQLGPVNLTAALNRDNSKTEENMKRLFDAYLKDEYGSVATGRIYRAWASPHETGLAIDFGNNGLSTSSKKENQMQQTPAWKWLKDNAYKYGFNPYYKEAWHWEVLVPLENWQTGEEFVTDGNYAVYPEEKLNKSPRYATYKSYWRRNILAEKIA